MKTINKFRNHFIMNTIKKIFFMLCLAVVSLSCSKDDAVESDELEINQQNTLGVWYYGRTIKPTGTVNYNHLCATNKDLLDLKVWGDVYYKKYNTACNIYSQSIGTYQYWAAEKKLNGFITEDYSIIKITKTEMWLQYEKYSNSSSPETWIDVWTRN